MTGNVSFLDAATGRNLGTASLSNSVLSFGASAPQALPDDDVMSSSNPATPANIIQADLNGDGVPDLFFSNQFNQLSTNDFANDFYVKLGDPAHPGAYLPGTAYHFNNNPLFADTPYFVIGNPIAIGDFNEDGLPDIAIVLSASSTITPTDSNPGIVQLLMNDPQNPGHFLTTATPIPVGNNPNSIVVGDFNKDGLPDLAVSNSGNGTIGLLLNTPTDPGQFQPMSTVALGPNTQVLQSVVVGDFNGDGTQDLAVTGSGQDSSTAVWSSWVEVLYGIAATPGQFSSPARLLISSNTSADALLSIGDLNKDGLTDLVVECSNTVYVSLAPADRSGYFTSFVTYGLSDQNNHLGYIGLGDVNGDGTLDVMGLTFELSQGSLQQGIAALYGDPARPGSFNPSPTYSLGSIAYITPMTFSVADINGDGLSD